MSAGTLHLLGVSPGTGAGFEECLRSLLPGDALLLLGEGVYAATGHTGSAQRLAALPETIGVHALREDCLVRGVGTGLNPRVACIDYPDFVALACHHLRSVSWY